MFALICCVLCASAAEEFPIQMALPQVSHSGSCPVEWQHRLQATPPCLCQSRIAYKPFERGCELRAFKTHRYTDTQNFLESAFNFYFLMQNIQKRCFFICWYNLTKLFKPFMVLYQFQTITLR